MTQVWLQPSWLSQADMTSTDNSTCQDSTCICFQHAVIHILYGSIYTSVRKLALFMTSALGITSAERPQLRQVVHVAIAEQQGADLPLTYHDRAITRINLVFGFQERQYHTSAECTAFWDSLAPPWRTVGAHTSAEQEYTDAREVRTHYQPIACVVDVSAAVCSDFLNLPLLSRQSRSAATEARVRFCRQYSANSHILPTSSLKTHNAHKHEPA